MAVSQSEVRASTPDRILDAAFHAVSDFGLSRVTVEDVAQRAGLSRQTVYRYFPSKDHLVTAMVSREEEKFLDGTRAAFATETDLQSAITNAVLFCLRFAREHPLLDRLLATDQSAFLPYLTTRGLPVIVRAREAMVQLITPRLRKAGQDDVRGVTDGAVRAMLSYILTPSENPPEDVAATMARVLVAALKQEGWI
jgi:AcrR family transcriptional regulator